MSRKQIIKLICLNLAIALLNVILFSRGFVGLTFDGDALLTAFAVTEIVMSVIAFGYGNYKILFAEPEMKLLGKTELKETDDYIQMLESVRGKRTFDNFIDTAIDQVQRLRDKDKALDSILLQHFSPTEMTNIRYQGAIDAVQKLFYSNVNKIINRILIFDDKDYWKTLDKISKFSDLPALNDPMSPSSQAQKQLQIYNEHIKYVKTKVDDNESILVKMDSLLLEISNLDDNTTQGFENLDVIHEINDLIEQTKLYKN